MAWLFKTIWLNFFHFDSEIYITTFFHPFSLTAKNTYFQDKIFSEVKSLLKGCVQQKKQHWFARILPFADWKSIYWILKCIFHLQKKYLWKNNIHVGKEKNLLIAASSSLHRRIDREKALIIFLANNQGNREILVKDISVLKEKEEIGFETIED